MGLKHFTAGIGFVSIMNYQYMKKYQEKTERDIQILLKEHKSVVEQIIAKVEVKEEKWVQLLTLIRYIWFMNYLMDVLNDVSEAFFISIFLFS